MSWRVFVLKMCPRYMMLVRFLGRLFIWLLFDRASQLDVSMVIIRPRNCQLFSLLVETFTFFCVDSLCRPQLTFVSFFPYLSEMHHLWLESLLSIIFCSPHSSSAVVMNIFLKRVSFVRFDNGIGSSTSRASMGAPTNCIPPMLAAYTFHFHSF